MMYRSMLLFAICSFVCVSTFSQNVLDFPVQIDIQPQIPTQGELVLVEGSIVFPHSGYRLDEISHNWDSITETISLVFTIFVDRVGFYPQVEHEVMFRHRLTSPIIFSSDISNHIKIQQVIADEPFVNIEPLPDYVQETLSVEVSPKPASVGKPIRATIRGDFPSSSYFVMNKSVTRISNSITINLTAARDEVDLPVITPFTEHLQIKPLEVGEYTVQLVINGVKMRQDSFSVVDNSTSPQRPNPFQAHFIVPTVIQTGSVVEIGVAGKFPTAGWQFGEINVQTINDITSIDIEAIQPGGAAATVITPFREQIAKLELPAGAHFIRGKINGHVIPSIRVLVGKIPILENLQNTLIRLARTGGFAGDNSWIEIDSHGNYEILNRFRNPNETQKGRLLSASLNRLINQIETSNFEEFPILIEPEFPVADAFEYSVVYQDTGIFIKFLESAPDELQAIVRSLEELLNNPSQTSNIQQDVWMIYN